VLGTIDVWITNGTSWLPTWLQDWAYLIICFVILGVLATVPLFLWLGYAVSTTRRSSAAAPSRPAES
jgi:hypothetical protein